MDLKGRAEVHQRTLRWLDRDAALAGRWIENGSHIPFAILVQVRAAIGTQRLV